jgi:hypothetical protein
MLVERRSRTPEQRTLNPRVRSRWLSALSLYLRDLAAVAHATRRAGQRRSRLRYQASRPDPFPMSARPVRNQTREASSPGTHAEHTALPGTRKPSAGTSELHPGSPASARIRHGRPYAPRAARRPPQRAAPPAERQFACRAATLPAARPDGPRRQPPWARELPEILRSTRRYPGNRSERKPPAALLAHRAPPAAARVRARAPGSALHAKPEWAPRGPCRWPSVKKPTVRTDRPGGTDAVRYTSVDTATHRPAVTRPDTRRDKKKTARRSRFRSRGGRFRRLWQVLGSNQRRLSRRFYRPLSSFTSHTPLTSAYAL